MSGGPNDALYAGYLCLASHSARETAMNWGDNSHMDVPARGGLFKGHQKVFLHLKLRKNSHTPVVLEVYPQPQYLEFQPQLTPFHPHFPKQLGAHVDESRAWQASSMKVEEHVC